MSFSSKRLSIESLERRECLSATVVEVEPNNNELQGTPFQLDPADNSAELIGTSQNDDDRDWFRFTVPVDGFLVGEVSSPNGNMGELDVERADGSTVLETDPDNGIHSDSGAVTAGEELFVRMRTDNGAPSEYSTLLTITDTDPGGNNNGGGGSGPAGDPTAFYAEVENNDRKNRATPFELIQDGVVQLQGTSQNDDDKDFFVFTMPTDGDVTFEVSSPNGEFAQLQIEDRFGNDIIETDPNDGINTGSVTLQGGENFFLRMRAKDGAPAQYEVNIGLTAATGMPIGQDTFATPNTTGSAGEDSANSGPGSSGSGGTLTPSRDKSDFHGCVDRPALEATYLDYAIRHDRHEAIDIAMEDVDYLFGLN